MAPVWSHGTVLTRVCVSYSSLEIECWRDVIGRCCLYAVYGHEQSALFLDAAQKCSAPESGSNDRRKTRLTGADPDFGPTVMRLFGLVQVGPQRRSASSFRVPNAAGFHCNHLSIHSAGFGHRPSTGTRRR